MSNYENILNSGKICFIYICTNNAYHNRARQYQNICVPLWTSSNMIAGGLKMEIAFLHLSDLHLQNLNGANPNKIQGAVQSLSALGEFEGIVLIISGDLAATGSSNEYKNTSTFLGRFIDEIKKRYCINPKNMKVLLVPGNHDINYGGQTRATPEEIRKYDEEEKSLNLARELKRMENFFSFADGNKCFFKAKSILYGQLVTRKILHFDTGYRIEANLLNTAPFSCNADDGLHFLPEDALQQLSVPSTADISMIIMHHSPDWFGFSQKRELEAIISQRCSIAFFGHEHMLGAQHVIYDNGSRIVKQAGGAWWQQSSPTTCEYYAGLFDSEDRSYILHRFTWNNESMRFSINPSQQYTLMTKPLNGSKLLYREEYNAILMNDDKHAISDNIADFFVFPDLRTNASKEYANSKAIHKMDELIAYIESNKYVAIVGNSNSGKTMLLKMLFKTLQNHMPVLYCNTDDITGRNQENIIKELVRNAYGENAYSDFQQLTDMPRAIIIDDLHRISQKHLNKFMRGIENIFDIIIVGTEETAKFDVVQMVKDNIKSENEFKKIFIARLYAEKRSEVISKVVALKYRGDELRGKGVARTLEQCLNTYKLAFRAEIDFVVQFADYYCSHMGELDKSDATVFSKVFEASIERAIAPNLYERKENTKDIIVALSEIAYYVHFHQEYPISAEHIDQIIKLYCDYYDNRYLTSARFLEIAEGSGLMLKVASGFEYRFKSKDHLAYFVAKALNRKFHDDGNDQHLRQIVEQSCFGINGDILMFLTYIADNVRIPRLLLTQATQYVKDWPEFDISRKTVEYLRSMPEENSKAPAKDQKELEIREQATAEEMNDTPIETLDIYDYDVSEIDEMSNQLIRAFQQLKIIARSLSAFISILPAPDKRDLVYAMYQMPNKLFNKWAESVDNSIFNLIKDIMEWEDAPEYKGKHHSKEEILKFFQEISLNTLLNLYFLVTSYGVNNSTVDYLSQQDYVTDSLNYRLERMMFYEKVDDYQSVIKEAEQIYNNFDDGLIRNMVLSILRHLMVHSDKILDKERRRIVNKYFSPKDQTRILLDRQKAIKAQTT